MRVWAKQTLYGQSFTDNEQPFKSVFELIHHDTSSIWMDVAGFGSFTALFRPNSDGQAKRAILLPDREQHVRVMFGFIHSHEQAHWWACAALWLHSQLIVSKVRQLMSGSCPTGLLLMRSAVLEMVGTTSEPHFPAGLLGSCCRGAYGFFGVVYLTSF